MYKIAVMGPYDSIYGFATLGLDTFPVSEREQGAETLKKLAESDFAVIYMTENLVAELSSEIEELKEQVMPAIIPIPGISGNTGDAVENVKKFVEQAVGADILFSGE